MTGSEAPANASFPNVVPAVLTPAEAGYDVHLVDATPRLVEEARRRNARAPRTLRSCRVGDARELPFEDEAEAIRAEGLKIEKMLASGEIWWDTAWADWHP